MKDKLFIPKKCKVGFNLRDDTYTGKLGYIIYHDGKVWRKEGSWESWREKYIDSEEFAKRKKVAFDKAVIQHTDYYNTMVETYKKNPQQNYYADIAKKTLEQYLKDYELTNLEKYKYSEHNQVNDITVNPVEFDNVPTEGFVLNKKAGGGSSHGWDARQTMCRVWDPRGFEFEITIPNLLFILQETNSLKGKGLEGEFVYSWDGKDLVLIPVTCQEYKTSSIHTILQSGKVAAKELVAGYSYKTKQNETLTYLGKFDFIDDYYGTVTVAKQFVFVNTKNVFVGLKNISSLANVTNETVVSNFAELIDNFSKSDKYPNVKGVLIVPQPFTQDMNYGRNYDDKYSYTSAYKEERPNVYRKYEFYPEVKEVHSNDYWRKKYITTGFKIKPISEVVLLDGRLSEKKLTSKKIDEIIPLEISNKLGFGTASLILNSGKKVKLN